jgi:hypothetical protein
LRRSERRFYNSSWADNHQGWRHSRKELMLVLSHRWQNPWLPVSESFLFVSKERACIGYKRRDEG